MENSYNSNSIKTYKGQLQGYSSEELHIHDSHQFLYINKGISLLIDHKQQQPQCGNYAAFIPCGTLHRSVVMGPELEFQTIFVQDRLFKTKYQSTVIYNISNLGKALFDYLCMENFRDFTQDYDRQCFRLFTETMLKDVKNETEILRLPVPVNSINMQITQYIHDNYKTKIRLSDFEKAIPYTMRHISKIFQQEMNMSVFDYIKIYRIMMSTILLHDSEISVQNISYESGYETISNFYKDFNYIFNVSPNEYRKRIINRIEGPVQRSVPGLVPKSPCLSVIR
jgi:AraC-like DNA-binding protein